MNNRKYSKKSLEFAKELRENSTDVEQIIWFNLRNNRLGNIKFRRQFPIGNYIVDFVCRSKRIIIELDGSQHLDNINYDYERTLFLNTKGYKVIRIYNNDVFKNLEKVLDHIYLECNKQ